jgi:D-Tyr-tRNAtyr deacylase
VDIILKSQILTIRDIKKKTKAKMFEHLQVGDKLLLSIQVDYAGRSSRGTRPSYISATNLTTGVTTYKTFNEIPPILSCFEFEEV